MVKGNLVHLHSKVSDTPQPILTAKYGPDHRGMLPIYGAIPGLGRGQGSAVAPYDPLVLLVLGIGLCQYQAHPSFGEMYPELGGHGGVKRPQSHRPSQGSLEVIKFGLITILPKVHRVLSKQFPDILQGVAHPRQEVSKTIRHAEE